MSDDKRMQDHAEVIGITGMMATGKSTVAELLAHKFLRSVHLR